MIIGIDATNIKSDGGVVHLFEIVNNFDFKNTKIKKLIIWGNSNSLKYIKNTSKIEKIKIDKLSHSTIYIFFWQMFFLPREIKKKKCNILFILGGIFFRKSVTTVSIFQNILPFLDDEVRRYNVFNRIKLLIQKKIYINTYSRSDGLIFLSKYSRTILNKNINFYKKQTSIIPHGVSDIFKYKKKRINKKHIKLIYVSKIDIYKNQLKVIHALKKLINQFKITLSLVGAYDKKNKKNLLNKITEMKINQNVKILGRVNYTKLPMLYNSHDIKIYASKSETFGMTMLEAMKCGLPILAIKNKISSEILSSAGFFCKNNVYDIKSNLSYMINNQNILARKIKNGLKISAKYKWKNTSKKTFEFLEMLGS